LNVGLVYEVKFKFDMCKLGLYEKEIKIAYHIMKVASIPKINQKERLFFQANIVTGIQSNTLTIENMNGNKSCLYF